MLGCPVPPAPPPPIVIGYVCAETGKPSYVVFHLPNPGKSQTIVDMRRTMLKKLQVFKKTFSDLGMKTDFLTVLGFLPQDKETDRMTLLQQ